MVREYKIDYDMFNALEIIKIIEFLNMIENVKTKKINKKVLIEKYHEYQNILRSKSLEKKYDKMMVNECGISIYRVMKEVTSDEAR